MQEKNSIRKGRNTLQSHKFDKRAIQNELTRVRCHIHKKTSRFSFYLLSKIGAHLIDGIHVHQPGMEQVKLLGQNRKTKIILMPMFKSFADPCVLFYITYLMNLELGFQFGNYEDSPKIHFVESLLKRTGTFLIKRS
jgi:hypothetical protein